MSGLQKQVADFLAEREQVIRAIEGCPASNMEDYWRWQGHAEARRVLRESLEREGVDLPEVPGIPVEKVRAQHADFLNRATWARRNGQGEAASIWVSAANLLQYLFPDEPTS